MSTFINRIIILFVFSMFSAGSQAQNTQDSIPLVISLTADSQANLSLVKNKIQSFPDVRFIGFCDNHKVFLMYVNPNTHSSASIFLSNLIKSTGLSELSLKEGTVKDIIGFCEFRDPIEYNAAKLQQTK